MFEPYPFERLNALLGDVAPITEPLDFSIGEPQFDTPFSIQKALKEHTDALRFYPRSMGTHFLKEAQLSFIKRRFGLDLQEWQIIPTLGSKEVLFNFPLFYLHGKHSPKVAFSNPSYQVYLASARVARAEVIFMDLSKENNFTPLLPEGAKPNLVILNSPNNPTGRTLDLEELKTWVLRALEEDFVLLNDECYCNIYSTTPPSSILEACKLVGNSEFKNVLAVNSISKSLSAPGLRSGYIAGDASILAAYQIFRSYSGCAIPLPLQYASAAGWLDSSAQQNIHEIYATNLKLAQEILQIPVFPTSFYVWLEVSDGQKFTRYLYEQTGLKVLPGDFLGYLKSPHTRDFVRIALVQTPEVLKPALECLKNALDSYKLSLC
ncbi:succinyldiaminopimelate transaminase [Helicobacter suis]|uniref:succinyldiaminopimelate transaminase n=1 Tax=Helicobacter suis TaxID=104628 RepID=UPI0013D0F759|nr:succinyldiaminopimelate transaminase [Helicobacter suis]